MGLIEENRRLRQRIEAAENALYSVKAIASNPHEQAALHEARARHDSVAALFGERAPVPKAGEDSIEFRRRALSAVLPRTGKYAGLDARDIPAPVLDRVEAEALQDAREMAQRRDAALKGKIVAHSRHENGRVITEFYGDPAAWMAPFSAQGASVVPVREPPPKLEKF